MTPNHTLEMLFAPQLAVGKHSSDRQGLSGVALLPSLAQTTSTTGQAACWGPVCEGSAQSRRCRLCFFQGFALLEPGATAGK